MGLRKKCKCGHGLTDHRRRQKNNEYYIGECEDWDCDCEKYDFDKTEQYPPIRRTVVREHTNDESMRQNPGRTGDRKYDLKMSDLGPDGRPIEL